MRESELAKVLWVRALEECDAEGDLLPHRMRDRAALEARPADPAGGSPSVFLLVRAHNLLDALSSRRPALARAHEAAGWLPPALLFAAAAFVLGLGAETLGGERRINLLALPLVGVLAWSLAVYTLEVWRAIGLLRGPRASGSGSAAGLRGLLTRLRLRAHRVRAERDASIAPAALARFAASWAEHASRPSTLRLRARLHLGGAAFGAGVIAGLYLAGFSFAYQATWESTFLEPEGAARFLALLFAPGSLLLIGGAPSAAAIAAIQAPAAGEAAEWIHRWSATLAVVVCAPRLLLAGATHLAAVRAARSLPVPIGDAYFTRVLAGRERSGRRVLLLPYSTHLEARAAAQVRELAIELFGSGVDLGVRDAVAYGADFAKLPGAPQPEAAIVVFNLAQTPEIEVHGRFLESLRESLVPAEAALEGGSERARLLILLDAERYAATAEPERVAERERTWQRVVREAGCEAVSFAASEGLASATLEAAAGQLASEARR